MNEDSDIRMSIYLGTLAELEDQCTDGEFSAFQVALFNGDAVSTTTSKEQRENNAAAIAAHASKLEWLHQNGYLFAHQQRWGALVNASKDDRLTLYSRSAKAQCGG